MPLDASEGLSARHFGLIDPITSRDSLSACKLQSFPLGRDADDDASGRKGMTMLHYALVFLIVALIAGAFGMYGVAGMATNIAWVLFVVFLVLFVVSLLSGRRSTPI
jgi:uncharacterized membrane protein YtjA (UPF0391 family)